MSVDSEDVSGGAENIKITVINDIDSLQVATFKYTKCNIPGAGADLSDFETQLIGCKCPGGPCNTPSCTCLKYGSNYDDQQHLLARTGNTDYPPGVSSVRVDKPIMECNDMCLCYHGNQKCSNRVVQYGVQLPLEVFRTEKKGWGLCSTEPIQKGSFVCEYAGEVLSACDAKHRTDLLTPSCSNYLIVVNEHLGSGAILKTYIDPVKLGNVGRFINHSCEPNLNMYPVRVNNNVVKLALFANQDIDERRELSFSYAGYRAHCEDIKTLNGSRRRPCVCGSKFCIGFLPFDESLF